MYNQEIINLAKSLNTLGNSVSQISRTLGINRSTISQWINNPSHKIHTPITLTSFISELSINNSINENYYYLLGQYLGDGYINKTDRTYRMRIFCNNSHENMQQLIKNSLLKIFPNNKIQIVQCHGCVSIGLYSNMLPELFPHLGKGEKHTRKIELSEWQLKDINHIALLRGLIHSDGTAFYRTIGKYRYLIYSFNNCSMDIINICKLCLDALSIEYKEYIKTKDSKTKHIQQVITISKRGDVARIYDICGIKS